MTPLQKPIPEARLTEIVEALPGGPLGYTKTWGYLDLARAVEIEHGIGIEELLNEQRNPS